VEYCLQSLKINSRNVEVLDSLGAALIKERRFDEAILVLQRAVKMNPKIAQSHYNLGVALFHVGASQAAAHHLRRARDIKPDLGKVNLLLDEIQKNSDLASSDGGS
jgi:Flp pilus assembly protein TadD